MARPSVVADVKRVAAFAARWGCVISFLCHWFPTHYRPICDAIDQIARTCSPGG